LGAINSLNLIDGMDGLLGSVGPIIMLALAAMAVASGHWVTAAVAVALAGALLAFLCFNFPPASIYLGDSGSMLVGLVVGVLAINSSLKAGATVALAAPAVLLTIPIFDTLTAIVRRKLTGRSIYATDRGHIHHCLLRSGLSAPRVLLLLSLLSLLTVAGVLVSQRYNSELVALIAAGAVVGILVVGRLFGYAEFLLIKERFGGLWASWRHEPSEKKSHQIQVRLQGSGEWQAVWKSLTDRAADLNLRSLYLDLNLPALHEGYHARWDRLDGDWGSAVMLCWRAEIPLVVDGQSAGRLEIVGDPEGEPMADRIRVLSEAAAEVERAVAQVVATRNQLVSKASELNGHATVSNGYHGNGLAAEAEQGPKPATQI
jgi:UDP-GlcNAc:undecaprenyl-phosphate/decaprenyl-phosphate GlcNAc-1-phosphate transferase